MTLIELIWVLCGVIGSLWAGSQFGVIGYILGVPSGWLAFYGLICIAWLCHGLISGIPRYPDCRTGKCKFKDFIVIWSPETKRVTFRCQCGSEFFKAGRCVFEVLADHS